jgi:UDP-glucose 4-epimerase
VNAVRVVNGRAVISDGCRGCGRCADVCPERAIDVIIEDEAFVDQSIARISPLVDL